jgi:hypothetical protein
MFTYKFMGLHAADAPTPYYYASLPAKPTPGHVLIFDNTNNRYVVYRIDGEGLVSDSRDDAQWQLAWADINRGEQVPTLWLQKLSGSEAKPEGRAFDYEEMKAASQKNRETRLSASA